MTFPQEMCGNVLYSQGQYTRLHPLVSEQISVLKRFFLYCFVVAGDVVLNENVRVLEVPGRYRWCDGSGLLLVPRPLQIAGSGNPFEHPSSMVDDR